MNAVADGADNGLGLGDEGTTLLHQVLRRRVVMLLNRGGPSDLAVRWARVLLSRLPLPLLSLLLPFFTFSFLQLKNHHFYGFFKRAKACCNVPHTTQVVVKLRLCWPTSTSNNYPEQSIHITPAINRYFFYSLQNVTCILIITCLKNE